MPSKEEPEFYTSSEVARMFRVDPKTPTRWEKAGNVPPGVIIRTPGGHRRWSGEWIRARLNGSQS